MVNYSLNTKDKNIINTLGRMCVASRRVHNGFQGTAMIACEVEEEAGSQARGKKGGMRRKWFGERAQQRVGSIIPATFPPPLQNKQTNKR